MSVSVAVFVLATVTALGCPVLVWAEGKRTAHHRHVRFAEAVAEWVATEVDIHGHGSDGSGAVPVAVLESATAALLRPVAPPRVAVLAGR